MKLSWASIQANAASFSRRWQDGAKLRLRHRKWARHEERSYAQGFVIEFLRVFGIDWLDAGVLEFKISDGASDYLWKGRIVIEMKSRGVDRDFKRAFAQLSRYTQELPDHENPNLWMACDFENVRLWHRSTKQQFDFKTNKLRKYVKHFAALAGHAQEQLRDDKVAVNVAAAEKMARLHDALKAHGYSGHDLEVYLSRLLFCLFANDTGIFQQDSFHDYIEASIPGGGDLDARITRLFQDLNEPVEKRAPNPFLPDGMEPSHFSFIDGGLFGERVRQAVFDGVTRRTLLDCLDFDWGSISPAIFGAMFQGVMDGGRRREIGAHYTSEENILRLIDPLFMDGLRGELRAAGNDARALDRLHDKMAGLRFLDPACGCGNFLIIAYRELRLLELELLKARVGGMKHRRGGGHRMLDIDAFLKVNVGQFCGIEIEEFPCQVARTGLWLMDHLMNRRASEEFGQYYVRLPLGEGAPIVHGNALRMDWAGVAPKEHLSYIMGNPPYKGFKYATAAQKEDMQIVFGGVCKTALLDYVSAWFKKAAELMQGTGIETAFISTNSVVQGTQVGQLWGLLLDEYGAKINFAHRTFKWSNEGSGMTAVYCVIIGFAHVGRAKKFLVEYEGASGAGRLAFAKKISPYLVEADNVVVTSRQEPLCDAPGMVMGNQAMDGGNLVIEAADYEEFVSREPNAKKYIKKYMMGNEFIKGLPRYCLWLKDCPSAELQRMPLVMERVGNVRKMRANSHDPGARRLAETPMLFRESRNPEKYAAIPITSSEARKYVPIGYLDGGTIAGNTLFIIEGATRYHFGILTSSVHMAWMCAVCARLGTGYRYSKDVVYNNFPWPSATEKQKTKIEALAQGVLDARAAFPDATLACLYDPLTMPQELSKAHRALDGAVMKLYGYGIGMTEAEVVTELMGRYKALIPTCGQKTASWFSTGELTALAPEGPTCSPSPTPQAALGLGAARAAPRLSAANGVPSAKGEMNSPFAYCSSSAI